MVSKCNFLNGSIFVTLLLSTLTLAVAAKEYIVQKGDTLSGLSEKSGVSIRGLKSANGLNGSLLKIGDTILIPDSKGENILIGSVKYKVRKGDTLIELGKKFGVSVSNIRRENNLRSSLIRVGQRLIIPSPSGSAESVEIAHEYIVKKGDTLTEIAERFGVSVGGLKSANTLKGSNIIIGTTLIIPVSLSTIGSLARSAEYVVKKGDNLSLIADKFDVSIADLKSANGISGTVIRTGQVLKVPGQDDLRYEIIKMAEKYLGVPYKFGGTSTVNGIDCSAFVNKIFGFFDVNLPRTAREIYKVGEEVGMDELNVGDLVFFETYAKFPSHVGIYLGNDKFIHASSRAKRVTINSMNERFYKNRYIGAKRIEVSDL